MSTQAQAAPLAAPVRSEFQQLDATIAQTFAREKGILQIVSASYGTAVSTDTNTWIGTGLQAQITRRNPASSILVWVAQNGVGKSTGNTYCALRLRRDGTVLDTFERQAGQDGLITDNFIGGCGTIYLDAPTAAVNPLTSMTVITYDTQFHSGANIASAYVQTGPSVSRIVLIEIV